MITWLWILSILYWGLTVCDCYSTNWNRAVVAAKGKDPALAEKAPFSKKVMQLVGKYWTVVRMFLGVLIWVPLIFVFPIEPATLYILGGLNLFIAGVVYYNSRKRFGLPWFW